MILKAVLNRLKMGLNGLNKNSGRFNIRSKNRNSLFTFVCFNNKEKSISTRVEENMNPKLKSHCLSIALCKRRFYRQSSEKNKYLGRGDDILIQSNIDFGPAWSVFQYRLSISCLGIINFFCWLNLEDCRIRFYQSMVGWCGRFSLFPFLIPRMFPSKYNNSSRQIFKDFIVNLQKWQLKRWFFFCNVASYIVVENGSHTTKAWSDRKMSTMPITIIYRGRRWKSENISPPIIPKMFVVATRHSPAVT